MTIASRARPLSSRPADMVADTGSSAVQLQDDDAEYAKDVLRLRADQTEDEADRELSAKAAALGIDLANTASDAAAPSPPVSILSPTCSTIHNRTDSTESQDTECTIPTTPTSPTSINSPSRPTTARQDSAGAASLMRKRAKTLSFSHYEKYISEVDPNLIQPKFVPPSPTTNTPGRGHERTFSAGSKASLTTLKRGLTNRLKWRRKPAQSSEVIM